MPYRDAASFYANPLWRVPIPAEVWRKKQRYTAALEIVTPIGHVLLAGPAASSFRAMQRDSGYSIMLNSAFRGHDEQVVLYNRMLAAKRAGEKFVLAAEPGTSDHESGLAIDIKKGPGRTWVARNGSKYGWKATVAGEPWHFSFVGLLNPDANG